MNKRKMLKEYLLRIAHGLNLKFWPKSMELVISWDSNSLCLELEILS